MTTIKPDKIIISNRFQLILLLLCGGLLILFLLVVIVINADGIRSGNAMDFVLVALMGVLLVFILLPRVFRLIGLMSGQPAMLEISDQVRMANAFGNRQLCYPLEDVAKISLYKRHFELTLRDGQEFSFSTAGYSAAQFKAFFSHIGLHCTHESDHALEMAQSERPVE